MEQVMIRRAQWELVAAMILCCLTSITARADVIWRDSSPHKIGYVAVNGVRLQYLDWGGTGPVLILIHGLGDNAHVFDDLAPAFTDRFHVLAYSRRGHGHSDATAPYDNATLTADLRGLMDALGIVKANLVGWSMGGNEITAMAAEYPERVGNLIYLDSYDTAEPAFKVAFEKIPTELLDRPPGAMASFDAYRRYEKAVDFPGLNDVQRVEAYLRDNVVLQSDGSVVSRMSREVAQALLLSLWTNPLRDYRGVHCPALAIYADSVFDRHISDRRLHAADAAWEQRYWIPFQVQSIDRMHREIENVRIVRVPGSHVSFFLTSRKAVVAMIQQFLTAPRP
jgi:pimeloyl-ACP methyl ester carboxylesterase